MTQPEAESAGRRRSPGPDQLKALLLFFVVLGHTYNVGIGDDPTRFLIYSFHMPAFLFLSGYLIDAERLRARSLGGLVVHYWKRMLGYWLLVSALWAAAFGYRVIDSPAKMLENYVLDPRYHLWYVPALMFAIIVAWCCVRLPHAGYLLRASAIAGMFFAIDPAGLVPPESPVDTRFYSSLIYFVFGFSVRNRIVPPLPVVPAAVTLGIGLVLKSMAYFEGGAVNLWGNLVLNLGLLSLLPVVLTWLDRPLPGVGKGLVIVGEYSLWVYLLHPFVTAAPWMPELGRPESYVLGVAVTLAIFVATVLVAVVWRGARSRVVALVRGSRSAPARIDG